MSKPRQCELCPAPLGEAYIVVHDPQGISGHFHTDCWAGAYAANQFARHWSKARGGVTADVRTRAHADAETLISER